MVTIKSQENSIVNTEAKRNFATHSDSSVQIKEKVGRLKALRDN